MKFLSLFTVAALAGNLSQDGRKCVKQAADNWTLKISGEPNQTGISNRASCIKAKCAHIAAALPADENDNEYWNWVKERNCNSTLFTCDVQKYQDSMGPCGLYKDCQTNTVDDTNERTCVPQQCKLRTSFTNADGDCRCGRNDNCMCKEDGVCQAAKSKRHVWCFQTQKFNWWNNGEDRLPEGYLKDSSKYYKWLAQHLSQDDNGNCTWSGWNTGGRNHPDSTHSNPTKWYASTSVEGLCCKGSYEVHCGMWEGRRDRRNNFTGDRCKCLDHFVWSEGATSDDKKYARATCSNKGRKNGGDGSGGTYTAVDQPP